MKFDVIIGNPPYQSPNKGKRNIGSPLWPLFIKKSFELIDEGGLVALVTPATWLNRSQRGAWGILKNTNIKFIEPNVKKYFPNVGGNGGTFSYFISENSPYEGNTIISSELAIDLRTSLVPNNTKMINKSSIEFIKKNIYKTLDIEVKSGPITPSINSDAWSDVKTASHVYETYYSGKINRRALWCNQPIGDYGKWKLVVATSGNIYNTLEITQKGVGRQANYVLGSKKELEHLKKLLLSADSRHLNELMMEGNYNNALKYIVNE